MEPKTAVQKAAEKKPDLTKPAEENLEKAQEAEKTLAGKTLTAEKRGSSSKEVGSAGHKKKKKKVGPYDEIIMKALRNDFPDIEMTLTKKAMILMNNIYHNLIALLLENMHRFLDDNDEPIGDFNEILDAILSEKQADRLDPKP